MANDGDRNEGQIILRDGDSGLEVAFGADGQILELRGRECAWHLRFPCYGWSLRMEWTENDPEHLIPSGVAEIAQPDAQSVVMVVDRMVGRDRREVQVFVRIEWRVQDGLLQGRLLSTELPADLQPIALIFPDLRVPYGKDVQWVVPNDIGMIIDNPCATQVEAEGMTGQLRCRAHMQFAAWLENGVGLYIDSRDTEGWIKKIQLRVGQQTAQICIEHLLPQPEDGAPQFPDYSVSIAPFNGGWYEAARIYRPWAMQQKWASRGPDERRGTYFAELACWLWNRGRIDNVSPATKEIARRLGLPVALDWYWWHKKPYDTGYPDYFPPREGHDKFCAAVKDLQENNIVVQVYTNGMSWDQAEPDWETEGKNSTVVMRTGEHFGIVFNTWMNRRLMQMCGAAQGWHERAQRNADSAAELGLDGLYMDMIAIAGGVWPCYSTEHGHVPGGGPYAIQGFRDLFAKIKKEHPNLLLTSEGVREMFQDLLEAGITLSPSCERLGGAAGCKGQNRIPLFLAVYHGHAVLFGNYAHIDGITPYDELWPPEKRTDPADEKDWHAICPDQFALELARTVAFGCQPLVTNLKMEHLTAPKFAADVEFFLDISRFYHAHREWLLWGEMLAPGEVHCDTVEVTCIQRQIFTPPESIEPFVVQRPAVFHSAWRAPDGQAGLVLINYTRQEQSVTVERADGLTPVEGGMKLTLPARSMRFVALHE